MKVYGKILCASSGCLLFILTSCAVVPKPLEKADIVSIVQSDQENLYVNQPEVTEALGLGDIMARAVRFNLGYRTQRMSEALALGQFELAKYDMLPAIAAEAGYLSRNNVSASRSVSIFTGNETVEPSTSQEQRNKIADLRFSWNILDFGVSYFAAQQEADRYMINDISRRKLMLNLLQQARVAYWNALAAQKLNVEIAASLESARLALADINRGLAAKAYRQPLEALTLKRQLLESIKELETLADSTESAKIVLANLINFPRDQNFVLKEQISNDSVAMLQAPVELLELTALANSTDVEEQIYNIRIERLETRKAIARLLPGVEFAYGSSYDSNEFLHNNHWGEASMRVSWNLLKLASTNRMLKNAKLREGVAAQRRMAVTMAVVTQLNLALQKVGDTQKHLHSARELKQIDELIAEYTSQGAATNVSLVEKIKAQISALRAHMAYLMAESDAQEAKGALQLSLGLSPIPSDHHRMSLSHLASAIEQQLQDWDEGRIDWYQSSIAMDESTPNSVNTGVAEQ